MRCSLFLLVSFLWLFGRIAHCDDAPLSRLVLDFTDSQGCRHIAIASGRAKIQITCHVDDSNNGRLVLLIPGKTTVRPTRGSLSEESVQVLDGFCRGESTCLIEWDKGSDPYFEQGQTTSDYAETILRTVGFLRQNRLVTIKKLGIVAHSEGALAAMILANRVEPAPMFIVLLAPPGVRGDKLTLEQNSDGYMNVPAKDTEALLMDQFKRLRQEPDELKVQAEFESELLQKYGRSVDHALIHDTAVKFSSPWMKAFIDLDPANLISGIKCPWLAVWGEDDAIITPDPNTFPYKVASASNRTGIGQVMLVDGYDHFFGRTKPPASAMDQGVGEQVHSWYEDRWRK